MLEVGDRRNVAGTSLLNYDGIKCGEALGFDWVVGARPGLGASQLLLQLGFGELVLRLQLVWINNCL